MCAWSASLCWTRTCGPGARSSWTGGSAGGAVRLMSPSSSSSIGHEAVADHPAHADDHAVGRVPAGRRSRGTCRASRRGSSPSSRASPSRAGCRRRSAPRRRVPTWSRGVSLYMFISSRITPFSRSISSGSNLEWRSMSRSTSKRRVAVLARAADEVARVLLAGEGVELAADPVDSRGQVARARPALGALEEHVLGEVRDPAVLGVLVARARRRA